MRSPGDLDIYLLVLSMIRKTCTYVMLSALGSTVGPWQQGQSQDLNLGGRAMKTYELVIICGRKDGPNSEARV